MQPDQTMKKTVLLVDDEPVVGRTCQRILISEGYEVDVAVNGQMAMDMSNKKHYDVCISDIKLPIMNGMDFYGCLKTANPELANRIIFMSGDILDRNTFEFLKAVKKPFLSKPFSVSELTIIIKNSFREVMLESPFHA